MARLRVAKNDLFRGFARAVRGARRGRGLRAMGASVTQLVHVGLHRRPGGDAQLVAQQLAEAVVDL